MPAAGKPGQVPSVLLSTQADVKCRGEPVRSRIQSLLSWQERLEKHRSKKLLVHWMSAVTPVLSFATGSGRRGLYDPFPHHWPLSA